MDTNKHESKKNMSLSKYNPNELTASEAPASWEAENPLLLLGGLVAEAQTTLALGEIHEVHAARGFITGVVVSCRHLLPPAQFKAVMVQWEIDPELLDKVAEAFNPEA